MNITIVLVTYNRINDLKKTLKCYSEQTLQPSCIVVVNNASKDETEVFLEEWKNEKESFEKVVINSSRNLGGAGGFALGIKEALHKDCEYVFISDDDAYPEINMLESLASGVQEKMDSNIVAFCTTVINNGRIDVMHRRKAITKYGFMIKDNPIEENEYHKQYFDLDYLTFVGSLIKKDVIEKVGLPRDDYFIREDDAEYSLRLRKEGSIVCITNSIMHHDTGFSSKEWLDYYTIRNNLNNVNMYFGKSYLFYAKLIWYIKRCSILAKFLKGRSDRYRSMCKDAIKDAKNGVTGFNQLYSSSTQL